jgi:hypothetical protein
MAVDEYERRRERDERGGSRCRGNTECKPGDFGLLEARTARPARELVNSTAFGDELKSDGRMIQSII